MLTNIAMSMLVATAFVLSAFASPFAIPEIDINIVPAEQSQGNANLESHTPQELFITIDIESLKQTDMQNITDGYADIKALHSQFVSQPVFIGTMPPTQAANLNMRGYTISVNQPAFNGAWMTGTLFFSHFTTVPAGGNMVNVTAIFTGWVNIVQFHSLEVLD